MALDWTDRAGRVLFSVAEALGLEAGPPRTLWPLGLLLLSAALGLILALLLHRPGQRDTQPGQRQGQRDTQPGQRQGQRDTQPGLEPAQRTDESRRRNRKKAGEKKLQRNGLVAAEPQEEVKPGEVQSQDPAELKAEKAKKNKKKPKVPAKEANSTPSDRKEPEEAGAWETKVSNREKRQQRRKDKGTGDESSSLGGVGHAASVSNPEPAATIPEEPKTITPATPTHTKNTTTSKTTITTKISTSNYTPASAVQRKEESPAAEVAPAVQQGKRPAVSPGWEEVLSVNGAGWRELSISAQVPPDTWNSLSSKHDMEGSWTFVDAPFPGIPATVESPGLSDFSMSLQPPVDNEWSVQNSTCVDPASDWSAPCEEWGNYEDQPVEGAADALAPPAELQESDTEKDKDEAAVPGSSKAKKKKKKKKKWEDGGTAAQVEVDVGVTRVQNTAGNIVSKTVKEQENVAPMNPTEPEITAKSTATPSQKKPEDSWESPKQVKKKKARRET